MPYSVVFFGTPEFALPSLGMLIADSEFDVRLVVTQTDKPVGRKHVLTPPPVKILAEKHGIPVLQPDNVNLESGTPAPERSSVQGSVRNQDCDFFVVVAYGRILSGELLNVPKIAAVNVHASLLPRWRGASPIQHAILSGDAETGVTVQKMVRELDAGPILGQERTGVYPRETAVSLHDRLSQIGALLLVSTLKKPLHPVSQDDTRATICRKLTREDGEVDPASMTAEEIDRRVRALNPWPGVACSVHGVRLKLLKTALEPFSDSMECICGGQTRLYLVRVRPVGKQEMSGEEFKRGYMR